MLFVAASAITVSHFTSPLFYLSYVATLPACARPHLELVLDWGHDRVEKDLSEIADHMLNWEEKLAAHLELTPVDIHDIKETSTNPVLQRLVNSATQYCSIGSHNECCHYIG